MSPPLLASAALALLIATSPAGSAVTPPLVPAGRPAIVEGELATTHFRVLYTPRAKGAAQALANRLEPARERFRQVLGRDWPGVTEVRLGVGRQELEALALPGGRVPKWAGALAYPSHNILLLEAVSLTGPEGASTLLHELAHVALGRLGQAWPRWFHEGLAMYLSGEGFALSHYATLSRAVYQDRVFHFEHLADGWPEHASDVEIAYAQSLSFVAFLAERHGPAGLGALLDYTSAGEPFETALAKAFHTSLSLEEKSWREGLALRYGWLPLSTSSALPLLLAACLCIVAFVLQQRRKAAWRAQLAAEEAAELAAELAAVAEAERALAADSPTEASPEETVPREQPWEQ